MSKANADLLCYTLSFSLAACFCGGITKNNAFNQSLQLCKLKNDNNSHHVTPTSTNLTVLVLVGKSKGEVKEDWGYHPPIIIIIIWCTLNIQEHQKALFERILMLVATKVQQPRVQRLCKRFEALKMSKSILRFVEKMSPTSRVSVP